MRVTTTFGVLFILLLISFTPCEANQSQTELRKKAKQGDATAQYNLGFMHDNGQGVPQNYAEAIKWYKKAA